MKTRPIKTIIVDDEAPARRLLKRFLEAEPGLEIVAECRNGREAIEALQQQKLDLVLLDISMPEIDGFGVIEQVGVGQMPLVIFVTAYDRHAIKAFEVHACDYVLKPFRKERLSDAIQQARRILEHRASGQPAHLRALLNEWQFRRQKQEPEARDAEPCYLQRLIVKGRDAFLTLELRQIVWIESADHYVVLHTTRGNHLLYDSLKSLEAKLDPDQFVRIHRTALVNLAHVKKIRPDRSGVFEVQMSDQSALRLSRSRREQLEPLLLRRDHLVS